MKNEIYDDIIEDMYSTTKILKSILLNIAEKNKVSHASHSNYHLLEVLVKKGTISMSELGDDLCISKPNLTVVIDNLIADKMVKRMNDSTDRRIIRIQITDKGEKFLNSTKTIVKKEFKKLLSNLDKEEIEKLSVSAANMKGLILKIKSNQKTR